MLDYTNNILTKLKSLYNVLDLMNNNIISKDNYKDVCSDINNLLDQLKEITKL